MPDAGLVSRARPRVRASLRRCAAALLLALPLLGLVTGASGAFAVTTTPAPADTPVTAPVVTPDPVVPSAPSPTVQPTTPPAPPPSPPAPPPAPRPTTPPQPTTPPTPQPTTPKAPGPGTPTAPSQTNVPSPQPLPSTRPAGPSRPVRTTAGALQTSTETEPTQADLRAMQDLLHQLDQQIKSRQDAVAKAEAELQKAALVAGQALETYSRAVKDLQAAELEDQRQRDLLTQAQLALTTSQHLLGRWVRQAYADGADIGGDLGLVSLLGARNTDDMGTTRQYLRRVGDSRSRSVSEVEAAVQTQNAAAGRAQASAQAAAVATTVAERAKAAADAAVKSQRDILARLEQALARSTSSAAARRARLTAARADFEAALRLSSQPSGRTGANSLIGTVGDCTGSDVQPYPNGQIPLGALCPLAADPGQHLRADAAYAFDRLSRAYVAHFGKAPCITDSYRTLEAQIQLYAIKPGLAAHPGTSNHGWGTALDLCGGIQSFDTGQHLWMLLNAPLYGWFHPAWAQRGGSKPEPWHWEFSG